MNILVITGSPHKNGTSALLTKNFIEGALRNHHQVTQMDSAFLNIHPCTGCEYCKEHDGVCVFKDDMSEWMNRILEADMLVFVTPLYYFGMSAQIKAVIDRFFSHNSELQNMHKQTMMIATCGDEEAWAMDALILHYQTLCRYMNFENKGILFAHSVYHVEDMISTDYPKQAFTLGSSI